MTRLGPLTWNVPIVSKDGRPTAEFFRKWNSQVAINDTIPAALDTPAEVSAVLDVLGAGAGALLVRGASQWSTLASPSDVKKYLQGAATPLWAQVKDSDLATTDVTDNNVSTLKHGFAPKLPNDATKYLDGTGAYSVPAGGGGGGGAMLGGFGGAFATTSDTTSNATKVTEFWTSAAITVSAMWFFGGPPTGATHQGAIFAPTGGWNTTTVGVLQGRTAVSAASTAPSSWLAWKRLVFTTPLVLLTNTHYQLAITRTDGAGTTALDMAVGASDHGAPAIPATHGESFVLASVLPSAGNTMSAASAAFNCFGISLEYTA